MTKADNIGTHINRWRAAQEARAPFIREGRLDLRYEAGNTWNWRELDLFRQEGREAPNYNLIAPAIHLVCGIEAQSRSDVVVLPRGPQDKDGAEALTKLEMLVRDQNQGARVLSKQFASAVRIGEGWCEVAYNSDPTGFPLIRKAVDPFSIFPDPCGKEDDQSDWLDMFRSVVTYPEWLAMRFPQHKSDIMDLARQWDPETGDNRHAGNDNDWAHVYQYDDHHILGYGHDHKPHQIRAVERWYKVEEWAQFVRLRDGRAIEPNKDNPAQIQWLARQLSERDGMGRPLATLVRGIVPRMRVALFLPGPEEVALLLADNPSPYAHNRFPFVPMWAYKDDRGVSAGMIRQLRSPQRDFNARMAHLLKRALTSQTHFEEGAFVDEDEARDEITRSDGWVRYAPGGLKMVLRENNLAATPIERQLLETDRMMIQDWSGTTAEALGIQSGSKSGIAMQTQIQQGNTRLYTLFDQRNWTQERVAELEIVNIQHTFTHEQAVRVTESGKGLDWVIINQAQPDGTVANDIVNTAYDVKISLTSMRDTQAMLALESITNLASQMAPDLQALFAPQIARLAAMATNMPDSQQLIDDLEQIKQVMMQRMTGGGAPDPQAQQMQQQAMQLQLAGQEAAVAKTQAEAANAQADAMLKTQQAAMPPAGPVIA